MNDQDPLSQLRDIHMPGDVSFWPPAPGWWIVAGLMLVALIIAAVWRYRHLQQNRYRQQAAKELQAAWQQFHQDHKTQPYLLQLTQLLKRTALTAYPKLQVNSLQGREWLNFLDATLADNTAPFSQGQGKQLLDLPYRQPTSNPELTSLHQLCLRWLQEHRRQNAVAKSTQPEQFKFAGAGNATV